MTSTLNLFRRGFDTMQIAAIRGISEAQAHEDLTVERCIEKGLPVPYHDPDPGRFSRRRTVKGQRRQV